MGGVLEILRGVHWEASLMECQVVRLREDFRVKHWESQLVHNMEVRQALLLEVQMGRLPGYLTRFQVWTWP